MDTTRELQTRATVAALSPGSFLLALGIVLAIFVGFNPIWEARDLQSWDENIWFSYVPIPLLVAGLLLRERKLAWGPFLVETMKLGLVKLVITYLAAHTVWALQGPPELRDHGGALAATTTAGDAFAPSDAAPAPSVIDPAQTGSVSIDLRGADGEPRDGALVRIVGGLEAFAFAPPDDAVELVHVGDRFEPALSVAHTWQDVRLVSRDDSLHTTVLSDVSRKYVLNYPLVARGTRELMFRRAHGVMTVRCSVHGDAEPTAHVVVSDNPFARVSQPAGPVTFEGVPAGVVELEAWEPETGLRARERVEVVAGEHVELELVLAASDP